jgi:hypothetical protein
MTLTGMSDEDIFAGDVEGRLERLDRRVRDVVLDAQCRDWTAERPDRVGFARLGQVRHELRTAIRRYNSIPKPDGWAWTLLTTAVWPVTTLVILILADRPAAPLTLASALVAGLIASQGAISVSGRLRRRPRAVPIEEPALYADLTQRIEACAATARADPKPERHAVADDLGRALDWVSATRDEITRGSSSAAR